MPVDLKTGLGIFNKQWLIEPSAALQMFNFWESMSAENKWNYRKAKGESGERSELSTYQVYNKFFAQSGIKMAPDNSWDMDEFAGFDGATIAVIPVNGPLMKNDFCGSFGTAMLKQLTQMASNTASVKSILFLHDSPGGTVDGTQAFADAIKSSPKFTLSLIDGMSCSADYWLSSSCDEVYASSKTDIIGSIGTMCSFYDSSKAMEARGVVLREYYATESKDKNAAFSDAQKGDGKKLISEMLDPMNNVFLGAVKDNRGAGLDPKALTGKTYTAENAIGMGLINGIKSFDEVLSIANIGSSKKQKTFSSIQVKNKSMTTAEIKAQFPEAYNEIFAAGATAEKDRTTAWLAFNGIDPESVSKGLESGAPVDMKVIAAMSVKSMNKRSLAEAAEDNPADVKTNTNPTKAKTQEEISLEANTAEVLKAMGIKQ